MSIHNLRFLKWEATKSAISVFIPKSRVYAFWLAVILFLQGYIIYVAKSFYLTFPLTETEELFSGTVVGKYPTPNFYKGNVSSHNNILLINFDSLGQQTINTNIQTYMTSEPGQRISFYLNKWKYINHPDDKGVITELCGLLLILEMFVLCILIIVWFFVDIVPFINALVAPYKEPDDYIRPGD